MGELMLMKKELEEKITFNVVQAKDISPFIHENGARIMGFHYFIKQDNEWLFAWIDKDTTKEHLLSLIEQGKVYVFGD